MPLLCKVLVVIPEPRTSLTFFHKFLRVKSPCPTRFRSAQTGNLAPAGAAYIPAQQPHLPRTFSIAEFTMFLLKYFEDVYILASAVEFV